MRTIFIALACVCAVAAVDLRGVPDVLSTQVDRITKVITSDAKSCETALSDLQMQINRKTLAVSKYQSSITTLRTTFSLNQQQLSDELAAIEQVKTLVLSLSTTNSSSSTSSSSSSTTTSSSSSSSSTTVTGSSSSSTSVTDATAKINALDKSSPKMAGVLRNIVVSVGSGTATSTLDVTEIISLLNELEENINSTMSTDSSSAEESTFNEKITVEQGLLQQLRDKVTTTKAECARRRSEFTDVLAVLKLVEQQYQNVTIPDCRPALAEKDKLISECLSEKTSSETLVKQLEDKLQTCTQTNPTSSQCATDLATCQNTVTTLTQRVQTLEKCESESTSTQTTITTLQSEITKLTTTRVTLEARLVEVREELQKQQAAAKCSDAHLRIQQLETRIHELSIKVELGEKCAVNYRAQAQEKHEMIKQLEKMTHLHDRLARCEFDSSKAAKECSDNAAAEAAEHAHKVHKLHHHIHELTSEISRLEDDAKCMNERTVIDRYEKEIVTIKTETKTVVTQVESEFEGCQAELTTLKSQSAADETKINHYYDKIQELEESFKSLQADHASCVDTHAKGKAACRGIAVELDQCRQELREETAHLEHSHSVRVQLEEEKSQLLAEVNQLESEETTLKSEVTTLTSKITSEESKIVSLTSEVSEHEANEKKLVETKTHLESLLTSKTTEYTTVVSKIETIESALAGEESGSKTLMAELRKLHDEREKLNNEKVDVEVQLKQALDRLSSLREFKKVAVDHLKQARDIISDADRRIDSLTARLSGSATRRSHLRHTLSSCDSRIKLVHEAMTTLKTDLATCRAHAADLESKLEEEQEAAQCLAHKATISELKKHGYSLRVEIKAVSAIKTMLVQKVSALEAKLSSWQQVNHKLQEDLRNCAEGHVGCRSSVRSLKNQLLSNLRKIKGHVTTVSRLEERLASAQMELKHTRSQWNGDRAAYKTFKDNLLEQMSKLIALAKDAKRKFDVARGAARNELKVQDAQWGVCRKEVLNYERILGSGVVKAEKEKMKSVLATKKYVAVKSSSEAALHKAANSTGSSAQSREEARAHDITVARMQAMIKKAEKASSSNTTTTSSSSSSSSSTTTTSSATAASGSASSSSS